MKDVFNDTKISSLFFKKVDDPLFSNEKCYLPPELQYHVSISQFLCSFLTFLLNLKNTIENSLYHQGEKTIAKKTLTASNYVKKEPVKSKQESIDYQDMPDKVR